MSLLAPEVKYYVLQEKWWGWGSGDIYDQNGTPIGRMHRHVISLRAFTEVTEINKNLGFTVNRKIVSLRPSYIIKDAEGNILGRTSRKILTLFRPKLWLENEKGDKLLEAQGDFLGRNFEIKDAKGKLKAKVKKATSLETW